MKHSIISFLIVCAFATLYGCSDNVRDSQEEDVKMEIKRLKKELWREKLRADLNEEIINVAEQKFNIQIRKKAGARQ